MKKEYSFDQSLDTLCAALSHVMGVDKPERAADACRALTDYADEAFEGRRADRLLMYNPDAIAYWIWDKYQHFVKEPMVHHALEVPFTTVMPSVTPVCFGTMYTGAQPAVHGIQRYEKPVIAIDTFFDALIRAGKKAVILGDPKCSLLHIFKERDMDYIACDTEAECLARTAELILHDEHDVIICYNGNYDSVMHKFGPESSEALAELRCNAQAYGMLASLVRENWQHHDTLVGFAMDHGCHEIDGGCGSHGLDMEEDLQILHLYQAYPRRK